MEVQIDSDAQRLYLNAMLSSPEVFYLVNSIVKPEYFDAGMRGAVKFIQEYFQEYRTIPSAQIFQTSTKHSPQIFEVDRGDRRFIAEQIASFCTTKAMILTAQKVPEWIEKGDHTQIVAAFKEASQIGLVEDLGIEYFVDVMQRLERAETVEKVISTGWKDVDAVIGGGVGRQELVLFLAPSGGGKSVNMLNLGVNFMQQGLHGVVISLEMRDSKYAMRADQMISGIASNKILQNKQQVDHALAAFHKETGARLFIKRMRESTTNANHVLTYVRELEMRHKFRPDWIIVDYLDIMQPARKVDTSMMFLKDQYVTEEVRAIGFDYDAIMISGSQLGKHATEKINAGEKTHQGDIQGGSSKTNTADLMISTVKTDAMHEAGEYRFEFPKARNSDASTKTVMMRWNKETLRVSDGSVPDLTLKKKTPLLMSGAIPGAKKSTKSIDELLGRTPAEPQA